MVTAVGAGRDPAVRHHDPRPPRPAETDEIGPELRFHRNENIGPDLIDHFPDNTRDIEGVVDVNRRVGRQFLGHLLACLRACGEDDTRLWETGAERRHDWGRRRHLAD